MQDVDLGSDNHIVTYTQSEAETSLQARWVVDAAGRASLLKRKLGLSKEIPHTINSAWLRLGGGLDFEQWGVDNAEWMAKMPEPGLRQYSTNHLLGEGYWVWLIPLSTGPISIGVCADPRLHPFDEINELDSHGRLAGPARAAARGRDRGPARRHRGLPPRWRTSPTASSRRLSAERWALVGEAGAFADPFYSPGSDFIGYGNTFTPTSSLAISRARTSPSASSTTTTSTSGHSTT